MSTLKLENSTCEFKHQMYKQVSRDLCCVIGTLSHASVAFLFGLVKLVFICDVIVSVNTGTSWSAARFHFLH